MRNRDKFLALLGEDISEARKLCSARTLEALKLLEAADWPGYSEKPAEVLEAEQKLQEMGAVDQDGGILDSFEEGELSAYWEVFAC